MKIPKTLNNLGLDGKLVTSVNIFFDDYHIICRSKIVKITNRVLLLWSPDDATLKALAESKLATKIYGSNDLGLTGPGNVNHVKNLKVINASTQFPGLDNYHAYLGLQEFGNLVVGEIKKVSLLYSKVA
mmetsp:Transcript_15349/g.18450  ORF Transcript_15349/g.18450 Transcript_15349/m.18450 type:complete len:129 (+) Transcript_15349:738-1124(+)